MRNELTNPSASAGTVGLGNVLMRTSRSLDGTWRAIVDPYDTGYVSILGTRNDRGWFRDFAPRDPGDRVEYDFANSLELQVPGDWNTQHDQLHYYEGTVWYRTKFDGTAAAESESQRHFLHFGAANHTARVFLDGEELATHVGGFGPFAVEVTGKVGPGEHTLIVQVNNRREPDRIPAMRTDWWNFGGITRSVSLVSTPPTFMRDAWLTMDPSGVLVGGVTVDAGIGDGGDMPTVTLALPDLGIEAVVEADGSVSIEPPADLERWQPGAPVLHTVRWTCGDDVIEDQIGFRTVRVDGTQILVNDQPVWLKGISLHGEGPSGGTRSHGPTEAATLLDWAQDLGANFVRLAHYQHDEHIVREADRRGLLIWCELPVYWGIAFDDAAVLANALDQTNELVVRDRSRAGVILWSVANETLPGDERTTFLASLVDRTRDLDPTRLTTAALLTLPSADPVVHVTDPLGEVIDVVAINQYLGWYYGDRDDIPDIEFSTAFDKPIIFSELGAGAKAGHHGGENEVWTEEFQAAVYRAQIAMIDKQSRCAGMSPWILKDFRTPLRVLPGIQDGYNRKGLFSEEGEPKLAADVLRAYYQSR
ncbi:MAG: glycoside hydrolase family 2 protein [Acidimicrobiales bacterium]